MFKRCHSLKKSSINISSAANLNISSKSIHTIDAQKQDKQNIETNQMYGIKTQTKINLQRSIQLKSCHTLTKPSKPKLTLKQRKQIDIFKQQKQLEVVKTICKQIQQIDSKLASYKDLLTRKQARHIKQKNQKIQQKESMLSMMIQMFQKQKQKTQQLENQLKQLGGYDRSIMYLSTKQPQLERRSTATFNYQNF